MKLNVDNNSDKDFLNIVTIIDQFSNMSSVWDSVASQHRYFYPFLCHDWFKVWFQHFRTERELSIVQFFKESRLAAIVPLHAVKDRHKGIALRKLELIGNVYSPVRSILFNDLNPTVNEEALTGIFEYLLTDKQWDMLDLNSIPEESGLLNPIRNALTKCKVPFSEYNCFGDWYQDGIDCSGEDFISRLPEKMRKDIQYCKRRLEREGQLEFKIISSPEDVNDYVDLYYEVYARSWQKREGIGPTFHRDLALMAAGKGWLRLSFLLHDGVALATQFWIVSNGTAFILKTVYDQDFRKYSPGKVLTSEMMKYVIDIDKVTTIDYVQGDEDYKKDWTPKRRERKGILVYNRTLKGRYLSVIDRKIAPAINKNKHLRKLKEAVAKQIRS